MGRIQILIDEMTLDPLGLGYTAMTNIQVASSMNGLTRSRNKTQLSSTEVLEAIEPAALMGLAGDASTRVWGLLGMPSFDPFGVAEDVMKDAFGFTSGTITALSDLRVEAISRAQELAYQGKVKEGHVEQARAKMGA